ncbi:DinB family protein [Paenibacillus sp. MBLB4367]|uniref:DinB family protein n=1 Tax=Paenibacillus sp. MBLB4367 TaxID=3384767 RepID=UPI00390810F5
MIAFHELEAYLDRKRADLLEALQTFGVHERGATEQEGGWTIVQIVEHLGLVERGVIREVSTLLDSSPANPDSSPESKRTDMIGLFKAKGIIGRKNESPLWALPKGAMEYGQALERLSDIRSELKRFLPELASRETNSLVSMHPYGVELNVCQWLHFAAVHEAGHVLQVKRIRAANDN